MYCPNLNSYNETLLGMIYPDQIGTWTGYLENYASGIGKQDPKEYVRSGSWKARAGNARSNRSGKSLLSRPCFNIENAVTYCLGRPYSDGIVEYFKPFGEVVKVKGKGVRYYVKDRRTRQLLFSLFNVLGSKVQVKVVYLAREGRYHLRQKVERQLKRFQACVGCGACQGLCPQGAITVRSPFAIDESRCVGCGKCLTSKYIPSGCIAVDVLRQR
jgi:phosphoadenosine phosphosulfate reductase